MKKGDGKVYKDLPHQARQAHHVPRIEQIKIPKDFIGAVIGKGGEVIQKIQAETNTIINIEEEGEFGIVDVASSNKEDIAAALKWIKDICTVPEVGDIFDAKVVSIVEFGAFMEFLPGKEGLMHISEYEWGHPETLDGLIHVGDEFQVKVIAFDEKNGKIKLSRKALLPKPEGYVEEKPARGPRREGGDRGPRKDGDRGGHGRREGGNGGERRSSGNGEGRRR